VLAPSLERQAMDWPSAGAFLKEHRRRIPRDSLSLGRYVRLQTRRGKVVTQEELAEIIGVSRVWYAMLESGAALNTSPRLLARLADALDLSAEDRKILFKLALPDFSAAASEFTVAKNLSTAVVPLRIAARRLWNATSESEILSEVAEALSTIFGDSDFTGAFKRIQPGRWDFPVILGGETYRNAIAELHYNLTVGMTPAQIDETMLYGVLTEPGQVGTRHELHRSVSQKRRIDRTFASLGFEATNFLDAHVKSREGREATIFATYIDGKKDFTEFDRAVMGALADLASLALS
jgi:transcriptional regulator with XRE-family HTH domain